MIDSEKIGNAAVNKGRGKNHTRSKFCHKCKEMKTIVNFVITALIQDNIETLSIVSVI